jgi:asparagine synthase (glutamine-hydrolysing)
LRSFDPAIPNDLAVYFALKQARDLGMKTIATGDASDELFGGYSFMLRMDDLESYIRRVAKTMKYSSNDIAKFFGLKIVQPFTDKSVVDFALRLPRQMKIRKTNGQLWGKWIVRKAFEDLLPKKLVWQSKRPLEFGSGMNRLRKIISNRISDEEFKRQAYPVRFLNKEHLYYYKIYCQVIGKIPQAASGQTRCPGCGGAMNKSSFHCKICGYVKDWRKV